MDEENNVSIVSGDEIIVDDGEIIPGDEIIIVEGLETDTTEIVQNLDLSTTSSIALQIINQNPNYSGNIVYTFTLWESNPDSVFAIEHTQTIEDTGGSATSPAAIFTGLSSESTYTAQCELSYVFGDGIYIFRYPTSGEIDCVLGTNEYEPDFSNVKIKYVSATATTVAIRLKGLDESYQSDYTILWELYDETWKIICSHIVKQEGGVTQSDVFRITGLTPSSSYIIGAYIFYGDGHSYRDIDLYLVETDPDSSGGSDDLSFADTEISVVVNDTSNTELAVKIYGLDTDYTGDWLLAWYLYNTDREVVAMNSDDIIISGGESSSGIYIFTDLTPGETYYVKAVLIYDDSNEYTPPEYEWTMGVGGGEVTGDIPNMDDVRIVEQATDDPYTKIAFRLEGLDERYSAGNWDIDWYVYDNGTLIGNFSDDLSSGKTESEIITISGLASDTTYEVQCRIQYYDSVGTRKTAWCYSDDSNTEGDFTTSEDEGFTESGAKVVAESSKDGTEITAYVSGLDTNYSRDGRWINWYLDDVWKGQTSGISAGVSGTENDPYLFTGLTPKTEYTIRADIHFVNNGADTTKSISAPVTTLGGRPGKFEWTYAKVKSEPFKLIAQEWRDLLDNINAVLEYKGKSKATTGTGLAQFTYPSPTDTFTALMYNQCLYQFIQLGLITEAEYGETYKVSSGDPVTADCLNLLVEMINSVE